MSSFWKRLQTALLGNVRQQVTRAGAWFTAATILVGIAAFASANNLLFLIFAAMLSTLLVSGFISRLSLAGLELDFVMPEHIAAKRRLSARVALRNNKRFMPSFSIHLDCPAASGFASALYIPSIPSAQIVEESVELYFPRRGSHQENEFQVSTRFPFGFTERHIDVTLKREIIVYPSIDPNPSLPGMLAIIGQEIAAHLQGRGTDFYRHRPYEHFESARHVDWKVTAHTRELQVREFSRDQKTPVIVVLDRKIADSEAAWFEEAIECCAWLAWELSRRETEIRFITQGFDVRVPAEGSVYTILKFLALTESSRTSLSAAPHDPSAYTLVFSASADHTHPFGLVAHGRVLGPAEFDAGRTGTPDVAGKDAGGKDAAGKTKD